MGSPTSLGCNGTCGSSQQPTGPTGQARWGRPPAQPPDSAGRSGRQLPGGRRGPGCPVGPVPGQPWPCPHRDPCFSQRGEARLGMSTRGCTGHCPSRGHLWPVFPRGPACLPSAGSPQELSSTQKQHDKLPWATLATSHPTPSLEVPTLMPRKPASTGSGPDTSAEPQRQSLAFTQWPCPGRSPCPEPLGCLQPSPSLAPVLGLGPLCLHSTPHRGRAALSSLSPLVLLPAPRLAGRPGDRPSERFQGWATPLRLHTEAGPATPHQAPPRPAAVRRFLGGWGHWEPWSVPGAEAGLHRRQLHVSFRNLPERSQGKGTKLGLLSSF
uniref:Uncharacterized protein n=1 Tax=Molossus molossus TaxID=27622 RepID=A0A7J8JW76_MOLMO|nr:hypothetical protein HJG59_007779 [Molossus molossus]